jgi:hypothetical protein
LEEARKFKALSILVNFAESADAVCLVLVPEP